MHKNVENIEQAKWMSLKSRLHCFVCCCHGNHCRLLRESNNSGWWTKLFNSSFLTASLQVGTSAMTHYLYVPSHSSLTEKWIQELEEPVKKQECWCEWIIGLTWLHPCRFCSELKETDWVPGFVLVLQVRNGQTWQVFLNWPGNPTLGFTNTSWSRGIQSRGHTQIVVSKCERL